MEQRREIWAWAFYDFANSAYSTSVTAVVFNVYFIEVVVGPAGFSWPGGWLSGSSIWGYAVSFSMLLVAIAAPVLGAIADNSGVKKVFLFVCCYLGVMTTGFLYLVGPGDVWLGVGLFVVSNLALEASFSFYSAFLPEITTGDRMGRVSGLGWAFGYVGGVLCLVLNLAMIRAPHWFGLTSADYVPVRASLVVVALWWGVFSLPTLLWLRERATPRALPPGASRVAFGLKQLYQTCRQLNRHRELLKFLVAFLVYNDGIQTVILMAAPFGAQVLGMKQDELILCFILIQAVAFIGALLFGYLADWMTSKTAIIITLFVFIACMAWVLVLDRTWQFWLLGVVVGLVLGGSQSASRALFALFTPPSNSAEFFGFFSVSGKFASVVGPALFALVAQLTGAVRYAAASVLILFAVGLILLYWVDEQKGIEEGRRAMEVMASS